VAVVRWTDRNGRNGNMGNYVISWTEESWYRMNITADSAEEALDMFHSGDVDYSGAVNTGNELQDSVTVEESA
jgi:hypothetical protein